MPYSSPSNAVGRAWWFESKITEVPCHNHCCRQKGHAIFCTCFKHTGERWSVLFLILVPSNWCWYSSRLGWSRHGEKSMYNASWGALACVFRTGNFWPIIYRKCIFLNDKLIVTLQSCRCEPMLFSVIILNLSWFWKIVVWSFYFTPDVLKIFFYAKIEVISIVSWS